MASVSIEPELILDLINSYTSRLRNTAIITY